MKRRILSALIAATVAAVPILLTLGVVADEVVEARSRCYLGGHLYNRSRQIAQGGRINAECGGGGHSVPWGNWGVKSVFGSVKNADQFAGWHREDEHWQWNSCTVGTGYQAPNADFYNRPRSDPRWWQETRVGQERVNSAWFNKGRTGLSCRDQWDNKVYTFSNLEVVAYELDWNGDDKVATLKYGDVDVRLSCSSTWTCEGNSGWKSERSVSPSSSKVSAEHYVFVSTEGK